MSSLVDDDAAALERVRQLEADEEYARKVWQRDSDRQQRRAERNQRQERFFGTQQGPDGMIVPTESATSPAINGVNGALRSDRAEPYNPFRDPALVNVDAATGTDPGHNQSNNDIPRMAQDATAEERQWNTKEIYWKGRSQRIVVQNENGPCSLIALCNILLLRGSLTITPEDRPAVSYSYLSSLLAEYVLDATSTTSDAVIDLEAALSILPQMQSGLDVNVQFSSVHGFAGQASTKTTNTSTQNALNDVEQGLDLIDLSEPGPSRATQKSTSTLAAANGERGELALFKACQVSLVHGWLADVADNEVWDAVVVRAGDYDSALDRIVAGDELTKSLVGKTDSGQTSGSSSQAAQLTDEDRTAAAMTTLPEEQKRVVSDALLIRRFLESTATQLTYPGLHALSTTLVRGELYALFRNSHLSVLYRPTEEELALALGQDESGAFSHGQPQLYQLVTDATLEIEDGIVWESIEDVDGSASRFFDGKFRPTRLQGDFVGQPEQGIVNEDADFAYAQHLQQQEQMRAERHRRQQHERRQNMTQAHRRQHSQTQTNSESQGLIARMLAKRKSSKNAPSLSELNANVDDQLVGRRTERTNVTPSRVNFVEQGQSTPPQPPSSSAAQQQQAAAPNGSKKWWKKVF